MRSRRITRILLCVFVAIVLIVIAVWWFLKAPPRWYQPPNANDEAAEELAALVEHRLAEELHKIREDDVVWRIRVREEQVNAWLATRMPKWLEHERGIEWPQQFGTPQIRFTRGRIDFALPAALTASEGGSDRLSRIITFTVEPRLIEESIRFTLVDVRIGRLGLPGNPAGYITRFLGQQDDDVGERNDLAGFLAQLAIGTAGIRPDITLVDDRTVVITELQLDRGVLELSAKTLRPRSANRE